MILQGGYICAEFRLSISQAFIVYARRWDARTSGVFFYLILLQAIVCTGVPMWGAAKHVHFIFILF